MLIELIHNIRLSKIYFSTEAFLKYLFNLISGGKERVAYRQNIKASARNSFCRRICKCICRNR